MTQTRTLGAFTALLVVVALTGCGGADGSANGSANEGAGAEMYFTDAQMQQLSGNMSALGVGIQLLESDGSSRPACEIVWDLAVASGAPPKRLTPVEIEASFTANSAIASNMKLWAQGDIEMVRMVPACTNQIMERAAD